MTIILITLCVNFAYMKLDKFDSDDTKKFQSIPPFITVCNFGSSHGRYGFNYEDVVGEDCFNFGLVSQSLSYDRRLFDCYEGNIAKGAVLFIPVSYFSFYGGEEQSTDGFEEKNKRYYKILPTSMIKNYDKKTDIYTNYFPSLATDASNLIKVLLGMSYDPNDEYWSQVSTDIDLTADVEAAYKRHLIKNKLDESGNRIVNQEELDSLKYIINSCKEKGVIPVLLTMPYLQEYTDEIKKNCPEFFGEFYSLINEISEETGVAYYDYAFDNRFINNYAWFANGDHLNKEGARHFTNILMDEVVHNSKK